MQYIAEIIARVDVIAVQEICSDLKPLKRLMGLLGRSYDYILTDVTHSGQGGNKERLGFIYDRNKVDFKGVSGEIVLPDKMAISKELGKPQFSRTPFGVEFQSGWFKFLFSTVHIYYGKSSTRSKEYARRVKEIDSVAKYLAKEARASDANQILVGDFNVLKSGSAGYNALEKNGFTTVKNREGSNKDRTKFYDQISFQSRRNELVLMESDRDDQTFQFFDSVYRPEDFKLYKPVMEKMIAAKRKVAETDLAEATSKTARKKATRKIASLTKVTASESALEKFYDEWRTFQMSDHLPLWVAVFVNFGVIVSHGFRGNIGISIPRVVYPKKEFVRKAFGHTFSPVMTQGRGFDTLGVDPIF